VPLLPCDIPAGQIEVQEIGGTNCIVLQQDAALGSVSSIVLRGSTEGFLDDVERAVDDGVNAYKVCPSTYLAACKLQASTTTADSALDGTFFTSLVD
jgi:hypothetical protein